MLRNRELRRFLILYTCMAIVGIIAGFIIGAASGILAVLFAAALGAAFFAFTSARYKSIARISNQIDLVLHNAEHLYIGEADEGELSILQSEITKMTLRIREQNEALKKEKGHLADSLADIAHQLKTPLTSAVLILSLLEGSSDVNERKAFVRETEELLERMDWLITALLKLSRLDAGIVELQDGQIDVKELVNAALRPFLIPMELHDVRLELEVPIGVMLKGDFGWLSEALQNILKNCMESVGSQGTIEVICKDNPLFTEITIHDSGAGFEKGDLPNLFDRFYRGRSTKAAGYGIGLALSKMIITRQQGTITAGNHPQGGAVFKIRFPK